MMTGEATKIRSAAMIDGIKSSTWGSRIAVALTALLLRGDYLAIVTLGFGEIIPRFIQNAGDLGGFNLTNGTIGIKAIDSPGFPFLPESMSAWQRFGTLDLNPWYYTILVLVLITVYVNVRLRDSRLGRAWISVREDETAAAMGIARRPEGPRSVPGRDLKSILHKITMLWSAMLYTASMHVLYSWSVR